MVARRPLLVGTVLALASCAADRPLSNIVLVTIDTLRADRLGCYGYYRDTSPSIDGLAAEGVLFEAAHAHIATTLPSHVSIMTATHPMRHGIKGNLWSFKKALDAESGIVTFAQILKELGYETAGFVSATPLKVATGIAAGFDTYDHPIGTERRAEDTAELALAWLDGERTGPFFLWVHLFDPHDAYDPPAPYDSLFTTDEEQIAYLKEHHYTYWEHPQVQKINNDYDGEIRYTDTHLGRVFDRLRELGLWDDAAVVLTADHGEGMGQHDWVGHGFIHQEQVRIPLILKLPGRPGGDRRDRLAAHVDVLPTLADELDLPIPEAERAQFEGRDLFGEVERELVFVERQSGREDKMGPGSEYSLRTREWKYLMHTEGPERLFRLSDDPYELENLLEAEPEVAREMDERLRSILDAGTGTDAQASKGAPPELLEELRGLGYVD